MNNYTIPELHIAKLKSKVHTFQANWTGPYRITNGISPSLHSLTTEKVLLGLSFQSQFLTAAVMYALLTTRISY